MTQDTIIWVAKLLPWIGGTATICGILLCSYTRMSKAGVSLAVAGMCSMAAAPLMLIALILHNLSS